MTRNSAAGTGAGLRWTRWLACFSALAFAAACADSSAVGPESLEIATHHAPGHGGGPGGGGNGGGGDEDPEVDVTVHAGFAVSDDGGGTYVSGECGALGRIWEGGTEDVTMTPGKNWTAGLGCDKRHFVVDLTDGTDGENLGEGTLTHLAVIDLNTLPDDGQWHAIPAQFLGPECDILRFDSGTLASTKVNPRAPFTSDDVWARTVDHSTDGSRRAWEVRTLDPVTGEQNDVASCINPDKGNKKRLDGQFHVSFSVLIEEQ